MNKTKKTIEKMKKPIGFKLTKEGMKEAKSLLVRAKRGFALSPESEIFYIMSRNPKKNWTVDDIQPRMRVEDWITNPNFVLAALKNLKNKKFIKQKTAGDITITSSGKGKPRVTKGEATEPLEVNPTGSSKMPKEVAAAIGSYNAKVTPEGKVKVKVKRL